MTRMKTANRRKMIFIIKNQFLITMNRMISISERIRMMTNNKNRFKAMKKKKSSLNNDENIK